MTLILAELGAETTTLTASLLHDTVEDTEVTLDQVGEEFGAEVRYLVDGVTKLEKVDYGAAAEPETFRKMLVATGSDVRVMSIKLADRLHNMRTLGVMRPEARPASPRSPGTSSSRSQNGSASRRSRPNWKTSSSRSSTPRSTTTHAS
ncbi:HD domain-containing protein [Streptomyces sp. L7]